MALSIQAQLKKVLAPFAKAVGVDIKKLKDSKQDKLKAGLNIQITEDGTISATSAAEAPDLSAYSTTEQITTLVDSKVANVVKTDVLETKLADYAKTTDVEAKVANVVKTDALETKLADYTTTAALTTKLGDYATTASLTTTLADYAKAAEVQPKLTAGPGVSISEQGVITVPAPDLTGYVKEEALDFGDLNLVAEYEAGKNGEAEAPAATGETATPSPAQPPMGKPQ